MPVVFDGVAEWLTLPLALTPPWFMATWIRSDASAVAQVPMWIGDPTAATEDWLTLYPGTASNNFWFRVRAAGQLGSRVESISNIWADGTWHHILVAFDAGGGVVEYFDGSRIDPTTVILARFPVGQDQVCLGRQNSLTPANHFEGALTRPAIWDGLPTQFIVNQLASGKWPARVRADDLRFFVPMVGSDDAHVDLVTSVAMTENGTPTTTADPPGLELAPGIEVVIQTRTVPVASAPVTNQNASATVTVAVNVSAGEDLIAVVHGHSSTAGTAITALSSDIDGAFVVDVEQSYDVIDPGQYTGIGRLMNPTPGAHVITATLSGPPVATAIAVYRVTGLVANPLFTSLNLGTVSVTIDQEIVNWSYAEVGMLGIVGSTCAQALANPVKADSAVGSEKYDVDWASLAGEYWGLSVDVSTRIMPLMGVQHPEATLRGYAVVTAIYEGVASVSGGAGGPLPLLGVG